MVDEITIAFRIVLLFVLVGVILLMAYALLKAVKMRSPFRGEQQRNFLKWVLISIGFGVTQFSLRFLGDYQVEPITSVTHYIANGLLIVSGLGMIKSAVELKGMKLGFNKPKKKKEDLLK